MGRFVWLDDDTYSLELETTETGPTLKFQLILFLHLELIK